MGLAVKTFFSVVQFWFRYDRWIEEVKTFFFTGLASIWSKYIHKFQREKDLCFTLSIVYIQISNTYFPEFLNTYYVTSRLTLYECAVNVCIQR